MKEYRLIKWYPDLDQEWDTNEFPIIVVEREDNYSLHPSLKGMTLFDRVSKQEVEQHPEFWRKLN